jgi:hypothetical protein
MRTLAMPKATEPWLRTSPGDKLIKIGAKVISHGRSHGEGHVEGDRIRVTSSGLQCLFGIRDLIMSQLV